MCTKPYVKQPVAKKGKCDGCHQEFEEDELLESLDDPEKKLCIDCFDEEADKYYPEDEYGLGDYDDDDDFSDDYYDNGHEEDY